MGENGWRFGVGRSAYACRERGGDSTAAKALELPLEAEFFRPILGF
jgi:hypothetical protein